MKRKNILIAAGVASALGFVLVASTLVGGSAPAPKATSASQRPVSRDDVRPVVAPRVTRPAAQAPTESPEEAKAAWLRQHFGDDLNIGPAAAEPAQAQNDLPPEGSPERLELEMQRTVELFPDTKEFIDQMKEDIAVAQHNAGLPTPVPPPAP